MFVKENPDRKKIYIYCNIQQNFAKKASKKKKKFSKTKFGNLDNMATYHWKKHPLDKNGIKKASCLLVYMRLFVKATQHSTGISLIKIITCGCCKLKKN